MKKFRCVPIAIGLPVIFLCLLALCLAIAADCYFEEDAGGMIVFLVFSLTALGLAAYTFVPGIQRVEIHPDFILCKGFPGQAFRMRYEDCSVGMDYHEQNNNKIWWIYLCRGPLPRYRKDNPANRINAVKIQPGFIRIMYSEEVFDALAVVLPRKQKTGLITARRCAGFERQGRIF